MEKVLIVYYSNTGSNRYLARKIASDLNAELAEIHPRAGVFPLQLLMSQMRFSFGIKKLEYDPQAYDRIVLIGPVWTGRLIAPLRSFLIRYNKQIKQLYFLTCCGSKDKDKDGKWGYAQVFTRIEEILGIRCAHCAALPITLIVPEEKQEDDQYILNARLTDDNFNGEIKARYLKFIDNLISMEKFSAVAE